MNRNLEYMGVNKLHAIGCKGQGLTVIVYENTSKSHGARVAKAVQEAAPKANVLRYYEGVSESGGASLEGYAEEVGAKIINISLASVRDHPEFGSSIRRLRDK